MRNGINVAAVSELIHEIRNVSGENEIHYGVDLEWLGGLSMKINTKTLTFGSKKMGRDFEFTIDHFTNPHPSSTACPADFFLCGVAACVANILVQSASYKEIAISHLNVQGQGQISTSTTQSESIQSGGINVLLDADSSRWQYKQMMMNVARFSPNYATATRANNIQLHYQHLPTTLHQGPLFESHHAEQYSSSPIQTKNALLTTGVDIAWRDGTQFDASLLDRQWKDKQWSLATTFCVDQPSAALGLNSAPNPQEYLISSIAADVAQHLVMIATEKGSPLKSLSASISCKLDMQGCFNIFDKSAVQLQDTKLHIRAMSSHSEAEMQQFIELACQRSVCWQSFINPCPLPLQRKER